MGIAVVQAGFLDNLATVFQHINLAFYFQLDRAFHKTERVQVFGFGASAQCVARAADGHVHVETHVALRHVAIADANGGDDGVQFAGKGHGFFCVAHIRFGDHFDQWCASTVQVDSGHAMEVFMQGLARIFFQVRMVNAHDFFLAAFQLNLHFAGTYNRFVQLCGLVAFWQIRIKIIFPFEHAVPADVGIDG